MNLFNKFKNRREEFKKNATELKCKYCSPSFIYKIFIKNDIILQESYHIANDFLESESWFTIIVFYGIKFMPISHWGNNRFINIDHYSSYDEPHVIGHNKMSSYIAVYSDGPTYVSYTKDEKVFTAIYYNKDDSCLLKTESDFPFFQKN